MNTQRSSMDTQQTAQEIAAYWSMRLTTGECGPADRAAFEAWRRENPANAEAYARAERALAVVDSHLLHPEVVALGRQTVAETARPRRRALAWGLAATFALFVSGAALWQWQRPVSGHETYETAVGERSSVRLADGSTVVLNTHSRLEVAFSPQRRSLRLVRGQAWFEVAPDTARPFTVEAGAQRVVALGTSFDVRLDAADRVQVTLVEGRVRVEEIGSNAQAQTHSAVPTELAPGQQLTAAAGGLAAVRSADLERVAGWREGRLILRDEPLEEVVAEINRYSPVTLVLADDPALRALRISGVFDTGRTASFVLAMQNGHGITSRALGDGRLLLERGGLR